MNRAVFDTNVIVSGILSPHGPPGRIVDWLREGSLCAVLDDRILDEYDEVLRRPAFGLPEQEVGIVLQSIRRHGQWVTVSAGVVTDGLPDPDDAPFLECARVMGVHLVTGNTRHYPGAAMGTVPVVTPVEYVRWLKDKRDGGGK